MLTITGTNVTIMVNDMSKAIAFYESIGLTLKNRWGDHYAMVQTADITIGIHPGGDEKSNSGTISIGFMIKDINEAKAELENLNIPFKFEDGKSGTYLHFTDHDGTVLYFVQPKWS